MTFRALAYFALLALVLHASGAHAICKDGEETIEIPLDVIQDCSQDASNDRDRPV